MPRGKCPLNKFLIAAVFIAAGSYYFASKPKHLSANEIDSQCDVVMFTTRWCGYCKKAREFFASEFAEQPERVCERDIESSDAHKALFDDLGGRGVPLIIIGNEKVSGYSLDDYQQALKTIEL